MSTPVNHPSKVAQASRLSNLRRRRLIRGAATPNLMPLVVVGFVLIALGIVAKGQGWTEPEAFKGLGLDLAQTITNLGILCAWVPVIAALFYKPLKEAMDSRNNELESTFAEAEALKAQMTQMRNDYEAQLQKAQAEAREQIQAQIKESQALKQSLMAEATAKADAMLKKAEQDIDSERHRVRQELRREVIDLSLKATEKLIGKNVDDESNRALVQEFIDSATVVA